jgi:hypothetical protein
MTLDPLSFVGRFVAVSLVLLLALVGLQAAVLPVKEAFSQRWDAIAEREATLASFTARAGAGEGLRAQRDALQSRQSGEVGLLTEASAPLAGAALQGTARRLFESGGGALRSIQVLPARAEGALQRVAVRVDGTLPSGRMLDFLHGVETAVPYLFVETFELRVPEGMTGQQTGHAQVTVRAELAAYRRLEAP